jgi:hypothetical protein
VSLSVKLLWYGTVTGAGTADAVVAVDGVAVDDGVGAGRGGPVEVIEAGTGADGVVAGTGAFLALSVLLVVSIGVVTGAVLALSSVLLVASIGVVTSAVLALSVLLIVSIGVVARVSNTAPVLALAFVLLVVSIGVVAGVKCAIDGWEDTIALGTVSAFTEDDGVAAEMVAWGKGCGTASSCFGSAAAAGDFDWTIDGVSVGPAAAIFKDAALVVAVTVSIIPELTPTNGTEGDGAVEGTTAGVGLTDSGRATLVCFVDCNEEA